MPSIKVEARTMLVILLIVGIAVLLLNKYSYHLTRVVAGQEIYFRTAGFQQYQTEHFQIKYLPVDEPYVDMIAAASEEAYVSVSKMMGAGPDKRTTIVVYPDSSSLARSFGWDKDVTAMGVYWAGSIRILSPAAWISTAEGEEVFTRDGPMVHEFAHLVVDEITKGNYDRWWTEAIAQYVEKQITGFEFTGPFVEGQKRYYYQLDDLEKDFDSLNERVAYWQALKAAEYIASHYGENSLLEILQFQGQGSDLHEAIEKTLDIDYKTFKEQLYQSLDEY